MAGYSHIPHILLRTTGFLALFLLLVSCGKKGPLQLPEDVRPAAITDLRVASVEGETVLTWSRPRTNLDGSRFRDLYGFLITRALGEDTTFRKIHLLDLQGQDIRDGQVTWTDPETTYGNVYRYRVYARNSLKVDSLPSNTESVQAMPMIPAPATIRGEGGDGYALISWDPVSGSTGYHVYRADQEPGPFDRVTDGKLSEAHFKDLIPNTQAFYYRVRSVGEADSLGRFSESVRVAPRRSVAPGPVHGLKASHSAGTVYLTWETVTDTSRFGAYEVCRVAEEGKVCRLTAQPSFADRDLDRALGEFRYEVRVIDNSASPVRGEVSAITVSPPRP